MQDYLPRAKALGNHQQHLQEHTSAAKSTLIFEKGVRLICSNFSFGTIASPVAFPLSLS